MMDITQILARARADRNGSIRGAARALGCTDMTYRMWERGIWTPGPERADAIARWTGLPIEAILTTLGVPAAGTAREQASEYGASAPSGSERADLERELALTRALAWFADIPRGTDIVDELIQERRQQAQKE